MRVLRDSPHLGPEAQRSCRWASGCRYQRRNCGSESMFALFAGVRPVAVPSVLCRHGLAEVVSPQIPAHKQAHRALPHVLGPCDVPDAICRGG